MGFSCSMSDRRVVRVYLKMLFFAFFLNAVVLQIHVKLSRPWHIYFRRYCNKHILQCNSQMKWKIAVSQNLMFCEWPKCWSQGLETRPLFVCCNLRRGWDFCNLVVLNERVRVDLNAFGRRDCACFVSGFWHTHTSLYTHFALQTNKEKLLNTTKCFAAV